MINKPAPLAAPPSYQPQTRAHHAAGFLINLALALSTRLTKCGFFCYTCCFRKGNVGRVEDIICLNPLPFFFYLDLKCSLFLHLVGLLSS
jgi:hypothetical protein